MKTRQEVFDIVKKHLLSQNTKSVVFGLGCAYRGDNGTKCGIGCLIPDDKYNYSLEGATISNVEVLAALFDDIPRSTPDDIYFLRLLQGVHDCYNVEEWPARFDKIAKDYGLNP